jgi:hypothetical protein
MNLYEAKEIVDTLHKGYSNDITVKEYQLAKGFLEGHAAGEKVGYNAGVKDSSEQVPSSWLDPLLSGPKKVVKKSPSNELESLLNSVKAKILSLIQDRGCGCIIEGSENH